MYDDTDDEAVYHDEILACIRAGDMEGLENWLLGSQWASNEPWDGSALGDTFLISILKKGGGGEHDEDAVDFTGLIELLVEHGADVRKANTVGFTPLHYCHSHREAGVILKHGAAIDAQSSPNRITPLMIAARNDYLQAVKFLLRSGADISMVDKYGNDAELHCVEGYEIQADSPSRTLIRDVKRAGGWKNYARAPRVELVRLRSLCARGRARPPSSDSVLQRVFGAPGSSKRSARASRPLPNEIFWNIVQFWRSDRDDD